MIIRDLMWRARAAVQLAIKAGKLPRLTHKEKLEHDIKCIDCGKQAQCWEHRDYTKPLDVDPVCQSCNMRRGPGYPYRKGDPQYPYEDVGIAA